MIFKRILEKDLDVWKKNPNRKPLILRGAGQIGKTTLVNEFAMKKVKSFPVGRVEYLYLHPLNFIEYF